MAYEPVDGRLLMLAIDDHLLPFKRNLCYYLSKPRVRKEPVLSPNRDNPSAPDHLVSNFYGTVIHDEGRFRMWYYGKREPGQEVMVCYAESDDGLDWTRPNLGQRLVNGSRDNNAFDLPGSPIYGATVIKDEDDPDPQRRYKMVCTWQQERGAAADKRGRPTSTLQTATSPDGIRWTTRRDWPIDVFSEHGCFFKYNGLYIVHGQGLFKSEGGASSGRQGYVWVSTDFEEWLQGWADGFLLPEPADPAKRGSREHYDQVHVGVGAASFGNVQVGLYGLWHNMTSPTSTVGGTTCDFGLVISNDGIHFREPVKGHVYISRHESPSTPVEGKDYPTILIQYNGILNVGDETRIYHGRWRNADIESWDYSGETALATLPRDRWGALGLFPDESEGWVWSAPVTLPQGGCHVSLNADRAQQMRVEVSDDRFNLLPEYSDGQSGVPEAGDGLDSTVSWPGGNLAALGGRAIRFRTHLNRGDGGEPRLYAINVRST